VAERMADFIAEVIDYLKALPNFEEPTTFHGP